MMQAELTEIPSTSKAGFSTTSPLVGLLVFLMVPSDAANAHLIGPNERDTTVHISRL